MSEAEWPEEALSDFGDKVEDIGDDIQDFGSHIVSLGQLDEAYTAGYEAVGGAMA